MSVLLKCSVCLIITMHTDSHYMSHRLYQYMYHFHTLDQRLKQCYITYICTTLIVGQNIHSISTEFHRQQQQNQPSTTLECCYNCIVFLDLTWYLCNYIMLMKLCCIYNSVPSRPNGGAFIACYAEFGLVQADEATLHWASHLSALIANMFKLNKHAKCLNLAINYQPMCIDSNSSLTIYTKACKLIALLLMLLAISSFLQLLSHEVDIVASYHMVPYLQCCYSWVITSNAVHNY